MPAEVLQKYDQDRERLIAEITAKEFDKDITLTPAEHRVEIKLEKLRAQLLEEDPTCITGDFYEKKTFLEKSKLYEALVEMPKPAIHHLHLTAACPLKYLIKLTYRDYVYYNQKENLFKVTKNFQGDEGYVSCN